MSKIPVVTCTRPTVDLALIDADVLRYELGAVQLDHPYIKGEKVPAPSSFVEGLVQDRIETILDRTGAKDFLLFLTGPGNFRFDIAKQQPYKGNREDFEKPFHWKTVDRYLRTVYPSKIREAFGNEADDELGIVQLRSVLAGDKDNTCIASRDKDLRTVEGWHYSWACGEDQPEKPLRYISQLEGYRFFFQQMLTGDNTDNIIGCGMKKEVMWGGKLMMRRKGVGKKAAEKLLDGLENAQQMYDVVREQYVTVFEAEADTVMLEQARLLFIGQTEKKQFKWHWIEVTEYGISTEESKAVEGKEPEGDVGVLPEDRRCEGDSEQRPVDSSEVCQSECETTTQS